MNQIESNLCSRVRAAASWASGLVLMFCLGAEATLTHVVVEDSPTRTVLRLQWHGERNFVRERGLAIASPSPGASSVQVRSVLANASALPMAQVEGSDRPLARLEPAGRYRGQWIEHLVLRSHRVVAGRVERIEEMVVEIRHGGVGSDLERDPVRARTLQRAVVNPGAVASAEAIRLRTRKAPPVVESTFSHSFNWMRIEVNATDVYRIGYEDFASEIGGATASRILADSIRLWSAQTPEQPRAAEDPDASWNDLYAMSERAIELRAAESTLSPGDEILAYLTGHEEWTDRYDPSADRWDHFESLYADRLAYWISWDLAGDLAGGPGGEFTGPAKRMSRLDGDPAGATVPRETHSARQHFEQNDIEAYGRVPDDWVWEDNLRKGRDLTIGFEVPSLFGATPAVLVTELRGRIQSIATSDTIYFGEEIYFNSGGVGSPDVTESWTYNEQRNSTLAPLQVIRSGMPIREGANFLTIRNISPDRDDIETPRLVFDGFSLSYESPLRPMGGKLSWVNFEAESSGGRWQHRLNEPGTNWNDHLLLDTGDPLNPRVIDGAVIEDGGATLRFGHDNAAGQRNHFVAARRTAFRRPLAFDARIPRLLRYELDQAGEGWSMVVLYNGPAFRSAAETLAEFREDNLPGHGSGARVTAVDVQDVYDVFGHGVKESTAIRNYLKFVQRFDGLLEYVCIIGDGSRDFRNRLPGASNEPFAAERDQVPTFIQTQYPQNPADSQRRTYAADDWLVSFDARLLSFAQGIDLPDVANGRLPAGNPVEARHLVDRIIDYESNPPAGNWRNTVLMVADDEVGLATGSETETFHILQAEDVSELLLDPAFNVDKLYLTDFPKLAGQPSKPSANQAMIQRWSRGRLIVHYIGHGSPTQMADENVFSLKDIPLLQNEGRLPLMLALSCDVAIFDSPTTKSMSEQLVLDERGGAIATIAATQVTFVSQNDRLTDALYPQLYPQGTGRSAPVGEALLLAKINVPGSTSSTLTQHNNQKYVLFGDPAFRLQSPEAPATLGGTAAAEILSAQTQSIEGRIENDGGMSSGRYYVRVHESAELVAHPLEGDPSRFLNYRLDGKTFFEGEGDFNSSVATANMISPVDMRFGDQGRIEILLETPDSSYLATSDQHPVRRSAVSGNDTEGPKISLEFLNNAHRVSVGDVLTATLEDSSGINVLGSAQLNSILIELDDEALPIDVSSSLKLDDGSYTRGTLEIPLPDRVGIGEHEMRLFASDMLGNRGSAEIQFEVIAEGQLDIAAHAAFPNPFRDGTRFVVEVNSPDPVKIAIDIYALDGTPIRHLERGESADGTYVLSWDGRDRRGDELANGTYLYAIRARFSGDQEIHQVRTGKIVRMR